MTKTRFTCSWHDNNGEQGDSDYFGRARALVTKYGGDATLFHVRCHYCRSGRIPRDLL